MNRDPRFALSQELEAKQTLLDQLHALAADDPDFFTDLLEGETNLLELIAALDASILDDETLADGAKAALDKLQARKRAAENRIELKRRLLAHTLQQIGLKTLRTPTATLTVAEASLKAIAVAPAFLRGVGKTQALLLWRERNRHALREFQARAPADALGVKQEFEKALAQDGMLPK